MNGGALITGVVAAGGGYAWLQVLNRAIAERGIELVDDDDVVDRDEPAEYDGPFRHFSTGYLKIQRAVAYGIIAVGVLLFVLALFS